MSPRECHCWLSAYWTELHSLGLFKHWPSSQFFTQWTVHLSKPWTVSCSRKIMWETLLRSRKTTPTAFHLSTKWVISSQEIKLVRQDQPFIIPCWLLLITQLSYTCLVMLRNSHLPQNRSLKIKCLTVNHICFLLQLVGRHRQNFLSFLSVGYKETVYWSDLDT